MTHVYNHIALRCRSCLLSKVSVGYRKFSGYDHRGIVSTLMRALAIGCFAHTYITLFYDHTRQYVKIEIQLGLVKKTCIHSTYTVNVTDQNRVHIPVHTYIKKIREKKREED